MAVKCLAIILKKVKQAQIGEVCAKLATLILDGKDALRDIYSICLKTLIADVPDSMGPLVADILTSRLLNGIARPGSQDIKRECLDNLKELLRRFGHHNEKDHIDIMNVVSQQLKNDQQVIRKRCVICLGSLAVVSSDLLLNRLVTALLDQIGTAEKSSPLFTRTLIQTIGSISRMVGYRLSGDLHKIIPLFLRFCGSADDESQQNDASNELRESCFPGIESFVHTCPRDVTPFLEDILSTALSFMKYDPNYAYDNEEDDIEGEGSSCAMTLENADDCGEDGEEYGEEDDAGSDNDDT